MLCAIPRGAPILSGEGYPLLFSWLLGLTNGIVGSIPMIQAPSKVPEEHRELAGTYYKSKFLLKYTTVDTKVSFPILLKNLYLLMHKHIVLK